MAEVIVVCSDCGKELGKYEDPTAKKKKTITQVCQECADRKAGTQTPKAAPY